MDSIRETRLSTEGHGHNGSPVVQEARWNDHPIVLAGSGVSRPVGGAGAHQARASSHCMPPMVARDGQVLGESVGEETLR